MTRTYTRPAPAPGAICVSCDPHPWFRCTRDGCELLPGGLLHVRLDTAACGHYQSLPEDGGWRAWQPGDVCGTCCYRAEQEEWL